MTYPAASPLGLLTREQVGVRLDLSPKSVDGLVKSGELSPVLVSTGGERRFWPDEIMAYALHAEIAADTRPWTRHPSAGSERGPVSSSSTPAASVPSAGRADRARNGRKSRQPAWPPFTGPTERRVHAYIAFGDRAHLVSYLRQRAEVELA